MDSKKVLYIQKKILQKWQALKGEPFVGNYLRFNILPLASELLFAFLSFVVDNIEKFQINSDIHNISIRYRYNLHVPNTNLSKYKKGSLLYWN
jgi:hypothetical protein